MKHLERRWGGSKATVARALACAAIAIISLNESPVQAGTHLPFFVYSVDTTTILLGEVFEDHDLILEEFGGSVGRIGLSTDLPRASDVVALHVQGELGNVLVSFDTTVTLPSPQGTLTVFPIDVARCTEGLQCEIVFNGFDMLGYSGASVDAVTVGPTGNLLISFDTTVTVNATTENEAVVEDADLMAVDGVTLTPFFDASAAGVSPALDLDAVHYSETEGPRLLVSFDGSGSIDGLSFNDDDILAFDLSAGTWSMEHDRASEHPGGLGASNIDALYFDAGPAPSPTPTPTATGTVTSAPTNSPTPSETATHTSTPASPTSTASATMATAPATATVTAGEPTLPPSGTPTRTDTPRSTATETNISTPTANSTATSTPGVPTQTPLPTSTDTVPSTATVTSASTATPVGATPSPTVRGCVGDCDGNGAIAIAELIRAVRIALELLPLEECNAIDRNADGKAAINELIAAVNDALGPCG